jgi:hypothetical protein
MGEKEKRSKDSFMLQLGQLAQKQQQTTNNINQSAVQIDKGFLLSSPLFLPPPPTSVHFRLVF